MKISERLNGKSILIWGYGREGRATENFIKKYCNVSRLEIFEGTQDEIKEDEYDYIIKSPGIPVERHPSNYTSQTQLFFEEFSDRIIGITGTKGKSTTSSLMHHVLETCFGDRVLLAGNIGKPCFDVYDEIKEDSVIVFELSCHQLAHLTLSPHIAVFLNLYEDHLDYYKTFDKYFDAKKNITRYQSEKDYLYIGDEVPEFPTKAHKEVVRYKAVERMSEHKFAHNMADKEKDECAENYHAGESSTEYCHYDMILKGKHNQYNAHFVYRVCTEIFNCPDEKVRQALKEFKGLPHRLEYVGNAGGVDYYNDSISTIPEATIQAIESIPETKTVLIGGMDRHIHYNSIVEFIKNNGEYNYILAYESGARIYKEVEDLGYCYYKKDLKESVELAREITPEGCACVFSPAAASYGYFKNFEHRGEYFKKLIFER